MEAIAEKKEINVHSTVNQEIIGKLVDREVFCCVSSWMDYMVRNDDCGELWDHISAYHYDGMTEEEKDEKIDELNDKRQELEDQVEELEEAIEVWDDIDKYTDEIRELREELKFEKDSDSIEKIKWEIDYRKQEIEETETPSISWSDLENKMEETQKEIEDLSDEIQELEDLEGKLIEVFEWYVVSNWIAEKLKEKGEVIIDDHDFLPTIWGRSCSGQAILLDYVFCSIAKDMEILEGQKYDWSRK